MPTVITTPGASNANSYVTVAEADSYFAEAFNKSSWAAATQANREAAVITASRSLDQYIRWNGFRAEPTVQSMQWPRIEVLNQDGILYGIDEIPTLVKQATFELAYYILSNNGISFQTQSIDRVKVAVIDVEFTKQSTDFGIPDYIEQMLYDLGQPILHNPNSVRTPRLQRV